MNDDRLEKLFAAASKENPPAAGDGLDFLVLQAIKREPAPGATTMTDQLNALFPRLAMAAIAVIVLCAAGDWLAGGSQTSLTDGAAQISQQWLLTGGGF